MNEREITISNERYKELLFAEKMLDALENMGVDNWEGYEQAKMSIRI